MDMSEKTESKEWATINMVKMRKKLYASYWAAFVLGNNE